MAAERESYEEEPTQEGWKPKSRLLRWITRRAEWHATHPHLCIPCPHCGIQIGLIVTTDTTEPDFVIRDDSKPT